MTTPSRLLTDFAAHLLPSSARDRYAVEFHAELAELAAWQRGVHAVTVLALALPLRLTIVKARAVAAGYSPTIGCLTGLRHRWVRAWTGDGERYQRCRRCGIDHTPSTAGSADYLSPNAWPR